jgi:beta-glucuronidase
MTQFNFQYPAYVWSEEYQVEIMSRHFEAFDRLRKQGFFVGEMIWNFADFKTAQSKYKHTIFRII